jgi:hypothetical protein
MAGTRSSRARTKPTSNNSAAILPGYHYHATFNFLGASISTALKVLSNKINAA